MRDVAANLVADIEGLLAANDVSGVETAVESLCGVIARREGAITDDTARRLLASLRSRRQFAALIRLAETLLAAGSKAERVRRLHAQALIDTDRLDEAEKVLLALVQDTAPDSAEWKEAQGLLGRVPKQRYVDGASKPPTPADAASILQAINEYGKVVARGRLAQDHWHTINFLALTARARRDGANAGHDVSVETLADELIAALEPIAASMPKGEKEDIWLLASLGEAYVAKGDWTKARETYTRYASSSNAGVNAFEVFSSLRQLVEVWGLKRTGPGAEVVAVLETRLGELAAKGLTLGASDARRLAALDAVLGHDGERVERADPHTRVVVAPATTAETAALEKSGGPGLMSVYWLLQAAERARAVASVRHIGSRRLWGTGFLIRGGDLHPSLGDETLFLTNSHVVGGLPGAGLAPGLAQVEFVSTSNEPVRVPVRALLWESPANLLDASLLRLAALPQHAFPVATESLASYADDFCDLAPHQRHCQFIGNADDQQLNCGFEPFEILDLGYADPLRPHHVYMHHKAPTRDGSSGSPIFDMYWNAVGLHRAGTEPGRYLPYLGGRRSGNREAKVAVSLKSIAGQMAADIDGARTVVAGSPAPPPPARTAAPAPAPTPAPARPEAVAPATREEAQSVLESPATPEDRIAALFEPDEAASLPFAPALKSRPEGDGTRAEKTFVEDLVTLGATGASSIFRARRNYGFKRKDPQKDTGLTLLSDGDSWFQFPVPRVKDTIDHLREHHAVNCMAVAGAEFREMAARTDKRIVPLVQEHRPDGVLLSGGGNDLLGWDGIKHHVTRAKPGGSATDHINRDQLDLTVKSLVNFFTSSIEQLLGADRGLRIFCHGYDWALPAPGGRWLNGPLSQLGISDEVQQRAIVKELIDAFNTRMMTLEERFAGNVYFVDCRGAVGEKRNSWYDELHPLAPGFGRIALRFNRRIKEAFANDRRVAAIA